KSGRMRPAPATRVSISSARSSSAVSTTMTGTPESRTSLRSCRSFICGARGLAPKCRELAVERNDAIVALGDDALMLPDESVQLGTGAVAFGGREELTDLGREAAARRRLRTRDERQRN